MELVFRNPRALIVEQRGLVCEKLANLANSINHDSSYVPEHCTHPDPFPSPSPCPCPPPRSSTAVTVAQRWRMVGPTSTCARRARYPRTRGRGRKPRTAGGHVGGGGLAKNPKSTASVPQSEERRQERAFNNCGRRDRKPDRLNAPASRNQPHGEWHSDRGQAYLYDRWNCCPLGAGESTQQHHLCGHAG